MDENIVKSEDTQKDKYLTFIVDNEVYALEIKFVVDIIGLQEITKIPEQPDYIKGVINLRGRIIPTMDVRARFKKEEIEYDDRSCIVVVEMKEISVGVIVDRVVEVIDIIRENISKPPKFNNDFKNNYISGIGNIDDRVIIILDCDRLLNYDQLSEMEEFNQKINEEEE